MFVRHVEGLAGMLVLCVIKGKMSCTIKQVFIIYYFAASRMIYKASDSVKCVKFLGL